MNFSILFTYPFKTIKTIIMAGNSRNKPQRHDGDRRRNHENTYQQETQNQRGLEEKKRRGYSQSEPNSYQPSFYMGEAESIDLAEDNWREWD